MRYYLFLCFLPVSLFAQNPNYDSLVIDIAPRLNAAGASVLMVQKGKVLLDKGYGYAHVGLQVPATPETKYFMISPGTIMLATAVLQQVEQGRISLDDNINKFLPEFPTHGKKIMIRHLLSSTSGIPDLHYLGDAHTGLRAMHRNADEVIDMFAGLPLTIEPGTKWDWSISNYALLSTILEKITGKAFKDYTSEFIAKPLALNNTEYLEPTKLITRLAEPYTLLNGQFYSPNESLMKYDPSLRFVTTTGDVYKLWRGLVDKKIISAKSYELMTGEEEMKRNHSGNFGYGIHLVKDSLSEYLNAGGALDGYSNFLYYNPKLDLTIIVLSNTSNQAAREIGRRLASLAVGLPVATIPLRSKRELAGLPVSPDEIKQITGTYILYRQVSGQAPLTYNIYKRTLRVFIENGTLVVQQFGDLPLPLRKQQDGNFLPEGQGSPYRFALEGDTMRLTITVAGGTPLINTGLRVGDADARNFRRIAFQNINSNRVQ